MYSRPKIKINACDWPSDYGCCGSEINKTIYKGEFIDRFGSENGFFFGVPGEPYIYRSLPWFGNYTNDININTKLKKHFYHFYSEADKDINPEYDYHLYKVIKPLNVKSCIISPAFGFPGGGTQYRSENNVNKLIKEGFIKEVPWIDSPLFDDSNIMGGKSIKLRIFKQKTKRRRNNKLKTRRKNKV